MSQPLVLTFDVGTQSLRAMLVDKQGRIVDKEQVRYESAYYSSHPGWAEQRPDMYWEDMCAAAKGLKSRCEALWGDIIAVTATTFRDSILCVDENGVPLRDMIVWLDKREADTEKPLPMHLRAVFALAGASETVELQRRVSPCNWIKQHQPEIWARTHRLLLLSGYLTFKLCGRMADSDASLMAHIPYDNKHRRWMKNGDITRCIFDVEEEKLCEIVQPGDTFGGITAEAAEATGIPAGLPLIATGSDKGCETLGLSVITPDKAAVSFGTTATIQLSVQKYFEPMPMIPSYAAVLRDRYNPELQVYRGYWLISWFKREFAAKEVMEAQRLGVPPEDLLNSRMASIPPGCEGLMIEPYFTPGVVMPKARGAMIGFSDVHTRIHIYRAIVEGINFALMDGLYSMERRGKLKVDRIFVGGGGSQSDEICRITADMFGLPVCRIQTHEACGLGSSMVAFVSLGEFGGYDEAVASMVHIKDVFPPDPETHELYQKLYKDVFTKIFKKMLPLYRRSMELLGEQA